MAGELDQRVHRPSLSETRPEHNGVERLTRSWKSVPAGEGSFGEGARLVEADGEPSTASGSGSQRIEAASGWKTQRGVRELRAMAKLQTVSTPPRCDGSALLGKVQKL